MRYKIIYRHWLPGDDDAILALVLPIFEQVRADHYRKKFDNSQLEAEAVHLAIVNEQVVGHVWGEPVSIFIEGKVQRFGMVTLACVAPDMRRYGIATGLMQRLHAYFQRKGYRGSILYTDSDIAAQLYRKVGYQEATRVLRTHVSPRQVSSPFEWTAASLGDLPTIQALNQRWAKHNFPVLWDSQGKVVHQFNIKQYRVLRHSGSIVGYAKWDEPSEHRLHGLIRDPIVPDEDPMAVIASIQAAIPAPRLWKTAEGGRYQESLRSCGCTFEPTKVVIMLLSFGQEIDLAGYHRTAWW